MSILTEEQDVLTFANEIDIAGILSDTENTVATALEYLQKYQKDLPALQTEI